MKNLWLQQRQWKSHPNLSGVKCFAQNPDDPNEIYIYHNLIISKLDCKKSEITSIFNVKDEVPVATENDLIDILFLSVQRKICLVFKTGEVLIVNVDISGENQIETQEFFSEGIAAVGLSPDQELIVILTRDFKMFLLYTSLDKVNESILCEEYFGEREFITVGWGKKETQFHGSEGKEAAKTKLNFDSSIPVNSKGFVITWRGDGLLYAVGFTLDSQAMFKIFNREGVLQYTSEKQPGLECNFAWRPSGNLIATTQVFPNKYVVSFFEKNGLKHGEFTLPFKYEDVEVLKLMWSGDSEILSICYVDKLTQKINLMLFTTGNYHWYLKQFISFDKDDQTPIMHWEESSSSFAGKCLNVFLTNGDYVQFNWVWCIDQSIGKLKTDDAVVGVIDGTKMLLTGFRHSVVPPPMASITLECTKNINRVAFGPKHSDINNINTNSICLLLEDSRISIYGYDNKKYSPIGTVSIDIGKDVVINKLLWLSSDSLVCLASCNVKTMLIILKISYDPEFSLKIVDTIDINEKMIGLKESSNPDEVVLQSNAGKLSIFSLKNGVNNHHVSFPEYCYQFDPVYIEDETVMFGLTHRNKFYIDDVKIANNVNSYFVHSDFLILTTLQHQLLCCPLSKDDIKGLQNANKSEGNLISTDNQDSYFTSRSVERGSSLVTSVACDTRTVLQMPRGNLEVIQPRALSLKIIQDYLNEYEYKSAFDLMRKQRINLNLICDHNLSDFLEHIDDFIIKIDNSSWLSLFISELDNQDVTKTMYLNSYKKSDKKDILANKVKTICIKMRQSLETLSKENKYLLPIITTYVKNNTTEDLEAALKIIKNVKDSNLNSVISAIDALKYLLYMVNVDELYNIALGLYDFDLVMFVASKSQKDPKEYVPYLNNLKNMEENYKRFSINNDLKRYEMALKYLIDSNVTKEDELLLFIKQHKLYKSALNQISDDDPRYLKIADDFGSYLFERKHYSEAGIMYKRSKNNSMAMECFTESLQWQSALSIAENELADEQLKEFKRKLLNKLMESGDYIEALSMLQDSPDIEQKVSCAIEGKLFKQTLNICQKYKRYDILDNLLKPAIIEQYNQLKSLIEQNQAQYVQQKERLLVVRENKMKTKHDGDDENYTNDCDLYSDTSSIMGSTSSRTSGRSFRSGKNRRKHERKLVSLKEGSRFEDVALIRALHVLITGTFNLRHDVAELNYVLYWIGKDSEAVQLQKLLEDLLNNIKKDLKIIWTSELAIDAFKSYENTKDSTDIPDASTSLEPHIRIAPIIQDFKWKMEY